MSARLAALAPSTVYYEPDPRFYQCFATVDSTERKHGRSTWAVRVRFVDDGYRPAHWVAYEYIGASEKFRVIYNGSQPEPTGREVFAALLDEGGDPRPDGFRAVVAFGEPDDREAELAARLEIALDALVSLGYELHFTTERMRDVSSYETVADQPFRARS